MSVGASAASRTSNLSMIRLCIFLSIFAVFPASNSSFSPLWRKEAIIIDSPHQVEHPIPRLSEWHTCLGIVTLQVTMAPIEDTVKSERARRNRIAAKQHRPIALGLRLTARVPGSRLGLRSELERASGPQPQAEQRRGPGPQERGEERRGPGMAQEPRGGATHGDQRQSPIFIKSESEPKLHAE